MALVASRLVDEGPAVPVLAADVALVPAPIPVPAAPAVALEAAFVAPAVAPAVVDPVAVPVVSSVLASAVVVRVVFEPALEAFVCVFAASLVPAAPDPVVDDRDREEVRERDPVAVPLEVDDVSVLDLVLLEPD
ncbi:hypothetical protein [Natrarchaeobaculum aegyptiacum]|uniref:hypothetical protein n=1 Tax=Natrarchaeobaculum aegyptiacum TaxID=745377 RepID=UPI001E3B8297|nr:hypothetical protein [Natrarchaeobaculum aegyptiacum]